MAATRRRAVLSGVTVMFLAAQLWVGTSLRSDAWPVTDSGMFASARSEYHDIRLEGTTGSGRRVVLRAGDFGLLRYQLELWIVRRLGPITGAIDDGTLRALARRWNSTHPGEDLVELRAWLRRFPLPVGHRPPRADLLSRWGGS